ncbi:thiamine phosphate synthase [Devosia sp.]|uniref:thiamine phosphate synthase n=1 Tax=Devosia sp. TaxID=1871048 RepID=UPI0032650EDA
MAAQLFLLTPLDADLQSFPPRLMAALSAAEVSALLVRRGALDDAAYAALTKSLINIGQGAGCAVLVEDDIALAKRLGADGVHITGDAKAVKAAVAALKPALIVGAGPFATRHDAMTCAELNIDYVFFGALDDQPDAKGLELAQWWAETFEIPAVLSDPAATAEAANDHGAEFFALSSSLWATARPEATLAAIAEALAP